LGVDLDNFPSKILLHEKVPEMKAFAPEFKALAPETKAIVPEKKTLAP